MICTVGARIHTASCTPSSMQQACAAQAQNKKNGVGMCSRNGRCQPDAWRGRLSLIIYGCQQDVLRLEVCVDELQAVQISHTLQQLPAKVSHHIDLEGAVLIDSQEVVQAQPQLLKHLQDSCRLDIVPVRYNEVSC